MPVPLAVLELKRMGANSSQREKERGAFRAMAGTDDPQQELISIIPFVFSAIRIQI